MLPDRKIQKPLFSLFSGKAGDCFTIARQKIEPESQMSSNELLGYLYCQHFQFGSQEICEGNGKRWRTSLYLLCEQSEIYDVFTTIYSLIFMS